jgi:UDP:flavonoid glycosyltransferase YjiC (YdhE family)
MMAVGQELRADFEPVLFTLSAALPIPLDAGFTVEHLASATEMSLTGNAWNALLEEGEYASSYDDGPTSRDRASVTCVTPIVYSAPGEPLDRTTTCTDLGLDADDSNVLIQLGAGQINDIHSTVGSAVAAVGRYPSVTAVVARSVLSAPMRPQPDAAIEVHRFPITRWMAAFDAAIIAGGYNSFHETMSMHVPAIVVPNLETTTDDQDARSRWAHDHGLAFRWDGVASDELEVAVAGLVDHQGWSITRSGRR